MDQFELSKKDIAYLKQKGLSEAEVYSQISSFKKGTPFVTLDRPCTVGDGILRFSPDQIKASIQMFGEKAIKRELVKFVPASGAATRMFKSLIQAGQSVMTQPQSDQHKTSDNRIIDPYLEEVMGDCRRFAFFEDLKASLSGKGLDAETLIREKDYSQILTHLLTEQGLNYANLPKGLIKFHFYGDHSRTAFEEHLVEASGYAKTETNNCFLHFTVSPSHHDKFNDLYRTIQDSYAQKLLANFTVSFSVQKDNSNTIAVDMENKPFRRSDGSILLRPGGHGALIENLNQLHADIVFIKNIDNVSHDRFKAETIRWKKILCGYLISIQEQIFNFLNVLYEEAVSIERIQNIQRFVQKDLCIRMPENVQKLSLKKQRESLIEILNRPLRVCGMVPNVSEPGGGPFWVKDNRGRLSIQIIETSQINMNDPDQQTKFNQLTHFNPVDIVCGLLDYSGSPFDLTTYVDHEAVFISYKSENGRDLKALELPGLWNGSMAFWNTIFVEVPLITFNPVKQLTDLLRETHQPS